MHSCYSRFHRVRFTYPGSTEPVISELSYSLGPGWTCLAGANGCGKTTVLMLACGMLQPERGSVAASGTAVLCTQRTDHPPALLDDFQNDWCGDTILLRDSLGVGDRWAERWPTLSHGERKRLQIAVALWSRPSLLAVDEPFNHLDPGGRDAVVSALSAFQGCGLLVSHDRAAMESLCARTLLFHPGRISLYNAGYSRAVEEEERERSRLAAARETAKRDYLKKKRDARRKMLKARTIQAHSGGTAASFRDICRLDLDGPSRVDGIVQKAGQRSREAAAKAERARERMESITYRKVHRTGIDLSGEPAGMNMLLDEAPGSIPVGRGNLVFPALELLPGDRIALTGPNGSGKSTLLRWMKARLRCPEERLVWIPQEIEAEEASCLLTELRGLSRDELGFIMTVVRRLGSDPERLLDSSVPSPGETRKLLLARGLLGDPWLIVMDEPTNHMDLPSVECLEKALAEYPGAVLLVSHDRAFLDALTNSNWCIGSGELRIMV